MINRVTLLGNLGADPEIKYMTNGNPVANITIATTFRFKNKTTGQQEDKTEWHRVIFFNKLAEIARDYLKKGSQVYIEGRLQTRKWSDNQGIDHYTTEIICTEMKMIGGRKDDSYDAKQSKPVVHAPSQYKSSPNSSEPPDIGYDDFNDEIPFN